MNSNAELTNLVDNLHVLWVGVLWSGGSSYHPGSVEFGSVSSPSIVTQPHIRSLSERIYYAAGSKQTCVQKGKCI